MAWRLLSCVSLIFIISTSIFTSESYIFQSSIANSHYVYSTTSNQVSEDFSGHGVKIAPPINGVYHGANPNFGGTEDEVTTDRIVDFEELAGKKIAWAYFSNNWIDDIEFPEESVRMIDSLDIVPFIRMMPRTTFEQGETDPVYTLQGIIDGDFDDS